MTEMRSAVVAKLTAGHQLNCTDVEVRSQAEAEAEAARIAALPKPLTPAELARMERLDQGPRVEF